VGLNLIVGPADTTVLGAALLAGVGAGLFASVGDAAEHLPHGRVVAPRAEASERSPQRERWRAFVQAAANL
jgi:glycerol kinase